MIELRVRASLSKSCYVFRWSIASPAECSSMCASWGSALISVFLTDLAGVTPDLPALVGVGLAGAPEVWVEAGFGVEV